MPCYHYVFHAYRSWNPDHPQGYYQRDIPGRRPTNKALAIHHHSVAAHPPVTFSSHQINLLIDGIKDITQRRNWRTHAVAATPNHMHTIISWTGEVEAEKIAATIKRLLGLFLAKDAATEGKPWFSRGSGITKVRDRAHLLHLIHTYFPSHDGIFWKEDRL